MNWPPNLSWCLPLVQERSLKNWYRFCGPPNGIELPGVVSLYPGNTRGKPATDGSEPAEYIVGLTGLVPRGWTGPFRRLYTSFVEFTRVGPKTWVTVRAAFWSKFV